MSIINSTTRTRAIAVGIQPDGDYVEQKADGSLFKTQVALGAGATYTSDWFDIDGFGTIEVFVKTNVPSAQAGIEVQWTDDAQATTPLVQSIDYREFTTNNAQEGTETWHIRPKLDGVRVVYTNGSNVQTDFFMEVVGRQQTEPGLENKAGAIVVSEFARAVALGTISNYRQTAKFGRNPEVDTGQPADVWGGGRNTLGLHDYTGFNATANEGLTTVSTSTADAGTLVSSGTVTTESLVSLIDSTATFVTDGVAVGDIVLNDTRGTYGHIKTVVSETQVDVYGMTDTAIGRYDNLVGNTYRIATAASTGAAVVVWRRILNSDLESQTNRLVILNGTTPVNTTVDAYRCSRGQILLAGSAGINVGELRVNQTTTTANIFCIMPASTNQTLIAADTVPKGSAYLIEGVLAQMSVLGGAAASAVCSFRTRPRGGVFNTRRVYDLSSQGGTVGDNETGGFALEEGTDFKIRVDEVSANNTRVSAKIEYLEINETIV